MKEYQIISNTAEILNLETGVQHVLDTCSTRLFDTCLTREKLLTETRVEHVFWTRVIAENNTC